MPIAQIIKHDNGDGTVTVTAITTEGHSATTSYSKDWPECYINEEVNKAVQDALDQD